MKSVVIALALFILTIPAQAAERRIAFVVGNANYQTGALPTPANDAGLVAQTLQAAGFDVTGARDLDLESLRAAFRDFLTKAGSASSDTVVYVYVSGYGIQLEGDNYFVPVGARIDDEASVASQAVRLSDYLRPLAALRLKALVAVFDLARANPFVKNGNPLSSGLALVNPEPNTFIAFNAAPGTVAPDEAGPYSAYAQALAETSREAGLTFDDVFARVRLRVNDLTKGAEVPWHASKLQTPVYLFNRAANAPAPRVSVEQAAAIRKRPIREFDAKEAYLAALDRDTLQGYLDFLAVYPRDAMASRVRAIVAARREAIIWRRSRTVDTPAAYWSYMRRYPRGAHTYDAQRRLAYLSASFAPPRRFVEIVYDVPPPPPDEIVYVERPILTFGDPEFDFAPPPPPPVIFLPPPPVYFVDLPPPPPPTIAFVLPSPEYRPVPAWVIAPQEIEPPPSNVIYNNKYNTVIINNTTNVVTVTTPQGHTETLAAAAVVAPAAQGSQPGTAPQEPSKGVPTSAGGSVLPASALLAPTMPTAVAAKAAATPNPKQEAPAKPLAPGEVLSSPNVAQPASPGGASSVAPPQAPVSSSGTPTNPPPPSPATPPAAGGKELPPQTAPAPTPSTPSPHPGLSKEAPPSPADRANSPAAVAPPGAVPLPGEKTLPGTPGAPPLPGQTPKLPTSPADRVSPQSREKQVAPNGAPSTAPPSAPAAKSGASGSAPAPSENTGPTGVAPNPPPGVVGKPLPGAAGAPPLPAPTPAAPSSPGKPTPQHSNEKPGATERPSVPNAASAPSPSKPDTGSGPRRPAAEPPEPPARAPVASGSPKAAPSTEHPLPPAPPVPHEPAARSAPTPHQTIETRPPAHAVQPPPAPPAAAAPPSAAQPPAAIARPVPSQAPAQQVQPVPHAVTPPPPPSAAPAPRVAPPPSPAEPAVRPPPPAAAVPPRPMVPSPSAAQPPAPMERPVPSQAPAQQVQPAPHAVAPPPAAAPALAPPVQTSPGANRKPEQ